MTNENGYRLSGFPVPRRSRQYVRGMAHYLIDHVREQIGWPVEPFPITELLEYWGSECGSVAGKHFPNFDVCDAEDLPHGDAEFRPDENAIVVRREIYEAASRSDPDALLVLAHETGHVMLLHRAAAGLYSGQWQAINPETDSEHQANWFADELMMDNRQIITFDTIESLMRRFLVSKETATRRLRDWVQERRELRGTT